MVPLIKRNMPNHFSVGYFIIIRLSSYFIVYIVAYSYYYLYNKAYTKKKNRFLSSFFQHSINTE